MVDNLIDFERLKEPISEGFPAGEDPRFDASPYSAYFTLKDVRNIARVAERNALVDNEPLFNHAHRWNDILKQVPDLLITQCKDLEFTAWYIEALARNCGFTGLSCGFNTAAILIEQFWQHLYPSPDEDGIETRIAPLIGLNGIEGEGTLLMPIACIPITEHHGEQAYSLWEYEQALEIERFDSEKKNQRINTGGVDLKDVLAAVDATSTEFYSQLYEDIHSCIESYNMLVKVMDDACELSLPTTHISKRLQACLDAVEYLAGDRLKNDVSEEFVSVEQEGREHTEVQSELKSQLNTRQEAISNLKEIAEFFKKTEPHSPMAYAIDQVVRWSNMALPDLLEELISDNDARTGYFRLVGIVQKKGD